MAFKTFFNFLILAGVLFTSLPSVSNSQEGEDVKHGRKVFLRCKFCHDVKPTSANKVGPNLENIMGRTAGSLERYQTYSKALKESGIIWSPEILNQWLQNPLGFLPGNKMAFSGVLYEKDRNNLIAYLQSLSN